MAGKNRLGYHHKEGCRHSFSGHIGDYHAQMILVHHEEIVEVASHLFGRCHGCIDLKILSGVVFVKIGRKHAGLDAGGHSQFSRNPFFLCRHFPDIRNMLLQGVCHLVKALCQITDLIIGIHRCPPFQITITDFQNIRFQFFQRIGDLLGEPTYGDRYKDQDHRRQNQHILHHGSHLLPEGLNNAFTVGLDGLSDMIGRFNYRGYRT